jgi:hypothetical protein
VAVDADFRVESDGNTHMLFVDAGNNRVGVGTSTPDSPFDVDLSEESSTALVSTFRAGSDNSNNRANVFIGQDDNSRGLLIRAGREIGDRAITQFILNGSGGTIGSNIVNVLEFYESTSSTDFETTFNQDGENVDFRVESDGNANALFVDAGSNLINFGKSDYRLKENIADADDAGSKIDAIQVRKFDWKVDGSHQDYGMVAQELQTVAPEAVSTPENPDEMMGVDYSKLVPMMLKEIQTLRLRITALENA